LRIFAQRLTARLDDRVDREQERLFPGVLDGVKGLAFVAAAVKSRSTESWQDVVYE
jgi:hypothetical protein